MRAAGVTPAEEREIRREKRLKMRCSCSGEGKGQRSCRVRRGQSEPRGISRTSPHPSQWIIRSLPQNLQHFGNLLVVYVLDLLQAPRNSKELFQVDFGPIRFPGLAACILKGIDDRLAWVFFWRSFQQALQNNRVDQIHPVGSEDEECPQKDERQQQNGGPTLLHLSLQSVVKVPRSTETGAAPAGPGALREHTGSM